MGIELKSGRIIEPNLDIVGISLAATAGDTYLPLAVIFEGYDQRLYTSDWTAEERRELAVMMIEKWREFADQVHP